VSRGLVSSSVSNVIGSATDLVILRFKTGIVKSEKTVIARQRLVETRFRDDQMEKSVDKQRLTEH
jgi:hypothetical protein